MALAQRFSRLIARHLPVKTAPMRAGRAIASVTFDDFPKSAWTLGGPLLARYRARGTYYTAGGLAQRTIEGIEYFGPEDLAALHAAGHEIGCHGFAHQPTPSLSSADIEADADRAADFLRPFNGGALPVSYAYPFGAVSVRTKKFYAHRFATARGVHPGVNAGTLDLAQLNTVGVEKYTWDDNKVGSAVAKAKAARGWIIFHTHDVSDNPSPYGCTPAMLESVLKALTAAGIEILPVREALRVAVGEAA